MKKMKKVLAVVLTLAMALSMATVAFAGQTNPASVDLTAQVVTGTYDDNGAKDIAIESTYAGFNPIIIHDSVYTIDGATVIQHTDGDGTVANDFSGYGSAIAVYGDDSVVTIKNTNVDISGVGALALFVDDGADVIVENSVFHSEGGTLYESYKNSPDQTTMVAPPWILGIMGTSRCTNLMGNNSSMTVIESETTAAQWAILSTDSGKNMTLNVVNSYMGLTGADYTLQEGGLLDTSHGTTGSTANPYTNRSGYGTYTIGNSNQKFYGVDMVVGTYANIYTGGKGLYTSMTAGETIELLDANGKVVTTYTPSESKVTTIDSDTFGFMAHQGTNALTIEKGTVVNSAYTTFLQKTGCSIDVLVSDSTLNPGNGIILQVMDNDDATTGMDMSSFSFYTTHNENAGWPTEGAKSSGNASTYTFSDMELVGDIFNGSGWNLNSTGAQTATEIAVVLNNTTLVGQISSTAAIHVTKAGSDAVAAAAAGGKTSESWVQYQNTSFPIGQYYDIGQVANMVASHGLNTIDVTVGNGSKWTVTADGIVNNLTAASSAIVADKAVTITVEGTLTLDGKVVTEDTIVGNVTYKLAASGAESAGTDVSGWVIGQVYNGQGEIVSGANAITVPGVEATCKVIDGDNNKAISVGDAILQYEGGNMFGWVESVAEDGTITLTTTYPLAAGGGEGGGGDGMEPPPGGGEGGGMGGEGGGPGDGMGPPPGGGGGGQGGGSGSSTWYTENDVLYVYVKDNKVVDPATEGATLYWTDRIMFGSDDNLSSFSGGGHVVGGDDDYAFLAGLYVNGGEVAEVSLRPYITHGTFKTAEAMPAYATSQNEKNYVADINDSVSWHNGVVYDATGAYTLTGKIIMNTTADGSDTNDFSGLGAAVMVNGADPVHNANGGPVVATLDNMYIETNGVAKLALFTDGGAISIVKNSSLIANGGVIWDGYMSTADQNIMVSPPWVLGLGGNADEPCNTRTTNLMGNYSVAAYVDSYFYAKGWGALSVDSGTNMNMVIVNSEVEVETSGYGAYNIGDSTEDYYGTTMDVSTYAIIMTGGVTTWQSYTGGQVIDVVQFSGETNEYGHGINGTTVAQVSSEKVKDGDVIISRIESDNFGFMMHHNGPSGWNEVNILDGTSVKTSDAIFLVKKINAEINVDNAVLESTDKGTILQIIDNDDDYVGLDFAATWGMDDDWGHSYGSHMPTFNQVFTEAAGYSDEWIAASSAAAKEGYDVASNWVVNYNMTNTAVEGDLWNSTGYVGSNPATTMNVNLGEGAEVSGIISAGAFSHDVKNATVGDGDWTGAEALGHVTNKVYSNGVNLVNVTVSDNAVWTLTGNACVNTLTVTETGKVVVPKGVTLTVGDKEYTDTIIVAETDGDKDNVPNTGDITPVMSPVMVLLAVLVLSMGVLFVTKRKA